MSKEIILRRTAKELEPDSFVNLGIGLPTGVATYVSPKSGIFFHSENGLVGLGAKPAPGLEDPSLTDAGGGFAGAVPGAMSIDSTLSFGLVRGGHLAATVLGGLQVDEEGRLANWIVPGKMVPGMGGAMDLVACANRVIVAMQHTAKGAPKIVPKCTLPLTADRRVDLIITDMAVIKPTDAGLVLLERAPGVTVEQIVEATAAKLIIEGDVPEMDLAA
ncbi:3-oxoacid CoA-transferase subunit B [Novosphingobium pituita]|jgi:3-oxoacid CoA-transferase subunit B/acetate CoA/acetoacetate CoA-transferase beta subunit|uniref:3-oxoacid CoA-transferase subunit B n=1 Tax=Novosphingobium pituita TaxID=3056842 RepID=A0ABQ6P2X6_9SPHN|nr:3-oxoacid CoA-transferase subunit B [Novosphingobium sp. IK01]MDK4806838.1 3-oxoacid CoA-transferase subunit B [Novosphingobium aromaticivorans]GMM59604.1 3-oxoacid CoA-transferase subunit B [Novosphingobium sp. IK01]HIQ18779.1 3-oxoacid CoA-transferase subunit B [Novosphingobium capsulatum]